MGKIRQFFELIRNYYFRLNKKQREEVSKIFHTLAFGSAVPVVVKLMSNERDDDWGFILLALLSVTIFAILSIAALASGGDE